MIHPHKEMLIGQTDLTDRSLTGFEKVVVEADAYSLLTTNTAFREACLQYERELINEWASAHEISQDVREYAYTRLRVLQDVLKHLDFLYTEFEARQLDHE